MNKDIFTQEDRQELQQHIDDYAKHHPDAYQEQWVPYMASFTQHWQAPVMTCRTLQDLERWAKRLPFACFHMAFFSSTFEPKLLDMPELEQVRALTIYDCRLTWRPFEALCQNAGCRNIDFLNLGHNTGLGETPECLEAFGDSPHFTQLRHLDLTFTFTGHGLEDLFNGRAMQALEHLFLQDNHVEDDGATFLAQHPKLRTLRALNLSDCEIGIDGARALLNSPHFNRLETLNLSSNPLDETIIELVRARSGCPNLKTLNISTRRWSEQGRKEWQALNLG